MTTASMTQSASDEDVRRGVNNLLDDYAAVRADDFCLIAYTPDSRKFAALLLVELALRGIDHDAFAMRPLIDPAVGDELDRHLPTPRRGRGKLVVFTLERDTMSHFDVFAGLLTRYPKNALKIIRIISASDELFSTAFDRSPRELSLRNATLLSKLAGETEIHVTTAGGTDLRIELDQSRYDWISNRGVWRPGAFTVLPAGEIATYPFNVNGTLVADGALNANVATRMDMRLKDAPLTVRIVDSVATDFSCARDDLCRLISGCFGRPNGRRVGELGFGTNNAATEFVPQNSHMNERFPSMHIGFGQHNQSMSLVPYHADFHLDVVTDDADIRFTTSGETLRMSQFVATDAIEHPVLVRDQDITGDCCSSGCAPRFAL